MPYPLGSGPSISMQNPIRCHSYSQRLPEQISHTGNSIPWTDKIVSLSWTEFHRIEDALSKYNLVSEMTSFGCHCSIRSRAWISKTSCPQSWVPYGSQDPRATCTKFWAEWPLQLRKLFCFHERSSTMARYAIIKRMLQDQRSAKELERLLRTTGHPLVHDWPLSANFEPAKKPQQFTLWFKDNQTKQVCVMQHRSRFQLSAHRGVSSTQEFYWYKESIVGPAYLWEKL